MGKIDETIFLTTRPLCRRYVCGVFSAISPRLVDSDRPPLHLCWVTGYLIGGECEVLDVWVSDEKELLSSENLRRIRCRGAEFIRFGIGNLQSDAARFAETFPNADDLPSIEQKIEMVVATLPRNDRPAVTSELRAIADAEGKTDQTLELARFQASSLGERYPDVGLTWRDALARFQPIYSLHPQLQELVRSADQAAADLRKRLTRAIAHHGRFDDSAAALDFVASWLLRAEQRLDRERDAALAATSSSTTVRPAVPMSAALAVSTPA